MMKRMSRLVSALLVLAMLCAMIPAAFAADQGNLSTATVNEVWVGDTFSMPVGTGCTGTVTTTYTKSDGTSPGYSGSNYVSYSTSTGKYTAVRSTLTTNNTIPDGYIVAKVSGNEAGCTHAREYKVKIYSRATTFTAKTTSVVVTKNQSATVDITLEPAATVRNEVKCLPDPNGVASATYDPVTKKVTISYLKDGRSDLTLVADAGTDHEKYVYITVSTSANAVVSIKKGDTVVAKTGTPGEATVAVGDKMTLTATVSGATGTSNNVTWTSSDPAKVYVSRTGAVEALAVGSSVITATSDDTGAKAEYTLNVIGAIAGITLKEDNKEVTSKEVTKSTTPFTITAVTTPAGSESSIKWTVSDANVLDITGNKETDLTKGAKYDATTKTATGASIKVVPANAGKATLTATVGGKSKSITVTVWEAAKKIVSVVDRADYTIRDGSDLLARFQKKYPVVQANLENNAGAVEVPVIWLYYTKNPSNSKEISVVGRLNESDESGYMKYDVSAVGTFTATAALTTEGEVTSNVITASSTSAVQNDKITFTCKAEAEPSDCKLAYQWYKDGTPISGATAATYTFTVPDSSKDSSTSYKFTCNVTATRNGTTSAPLESNAVTLTVSRDYSIELAADASSGTYTVGQTPKITATVYKHNGSSKTAVSNPGSMSWELLDASTQKALDSKLATVSGSGTSATVTTKATGSVGGQKITVRVTAKLDGFTYTGTKEITLSAASAGEIKMSVGDGAALKATTIQNKVKEAVKSSTSVTLSYVKFDTPRNCSLSKSSGSSTAIGTTACYFSTTTAQKLSDVFVKLSSGASSGSVAYTVYDNNDNAVATGTLSFDGAASSDSITCLGISFSGADAAEMIVEEYPDAEYVKFSALDAKYGRLLLGYRGIVEIADAKNVKDTDKYYIKNSSSVDGVDELYLLPRTDYYGAITVKYTAYSSADKSLGDGTLTFTVVRKTASSKFSDVTSANVGSWAADAIDFMAGNGLVGGTGNNKFSPTGTMTRCDLVLIMYRMAGQPSVTGVENPFSDVTSTDYFYKAVLWAYKNGVVNGTGANTFSPKKNITREQIASILFRYSGATTATGSLTSFTDAGSVSDYATTAMKWAVGAGIIGGSNGKLNPQGNATRAEVAVMLHRFLNK
ncbi:MAG: S-layer homology domain-containing protein [Oscillospiraceae bacterium]